MNESIPLPDFELIVRKYFDYLIDSFGFMYDNAISEPFNHRIRYKKKNRIVSIDLGYRHNFIEINIFDKVDKIKPTTQNFDYSVSLSSLMYKEKKSTEFKNKYDSIMPFSLGLDKSLSVLGELF